MNSSGDERFKEPQREDRQMQYLISVIDDGTGPETATEDAAIDVFNDRLKAEGYWVFGGGLEPATTATVVDGQGDAPVVTDGPYLESKEVIGGFWVIDAPDLDVALRLAADGSKACGGKVEVRPFEGLA
jgi:hypothetical protein